MVFLILFFRLLSGVVHGLGKSLLRDSVVQGAGLLLGGRSGTARALLVVVGWVAFLQQAGVGLPCVEMRILVDVHYLLVHLLSLFEFAEEVPVLTTRPGFVRCSAQMASCTAFFRLVVRGRFIFYLTR